MAKKNSNLIAIITMFFMFAMISFVTNMAAPFGNIWKEHYEWAGMLGNMMNFAAYLFMGIPAGIMLGKVGYKKTALVALALGFIGIGVQLLSSYVGSGVNVIPVKGVLTGEVVDGNPVSVTGYIELNYIIYLIGAFICGFCVCMLNTVVNPMLNILGGGGNKGNQLIQTGGTFNSLVGTFTPLLAGSMIGTITHETAMNSVAPLLFIALGVFLVSFFIIFISPIPEPEQDTKQEKVGVFSPLQFRHCLLGVIAIFFYVGIEVGIPGELNFYLTDHIGKAAGGATIGGAIAAIYWLLMMVGRAASSAISGKVSSRTQVTVVSAVAIVLIIAAIFVGESINIKMPGFHEGHFQLFEVPVKCLFLVLCGLCTSVMWGGIFNLSVEGLGKYTERASGLFMTMVVGGGVMPLIQDSIARSTSYMSSYWLVIAMLAFLLFYAAIGSKVSKSTK